MGRHIEMLAKHWRDTDLPFDRVVFCSPATVAEGADLFGDDEGGRRGSIGKTQFEFLSVPARVPNLVWEQAGGSCPSGGQRRRALLPVLHLPDSLRRQDSAGEPRHI